MKEMKHLDILIIVIIIKENMINMVIGLNLIVMR
jgi:hypothetical protein